jgi:hypothetical protein
MGKASGRGCGMKEGTIDVSREGKTLRRKLRRVGETGKGCEKKGGGGKRKNEKRVRAGKRCEKKWGKKRGIKREGERKRK